LLGLVFLGTGAIFNFEAGAKLNTRDSRFASRTICDSPKCVAVDVEESQVKLGHEYALKALEAQSRDRDSQRLFRRKVMAWSLWFGVFLVVLLAAFSSYALSLGKIEMVRDMMLQIFGTGGLGAAAFFAARSFYRDRKHSGDEE